MAPSAGLGGGGEGLLDGGWSQKVLKKGTDNLRPIRGEYERGGAGDPRGQVR